MNQIATSVCLATLVVLGASSPVRATAPDGEDCVGHPTPAKTYRAFADAAARNDWRAAFQLVSRKDRGRLYAKLVAGLIVASAFDDSKERRAGLERILRKHGFKIDAEGRFTQADQDISTIVQDWPALMGDISPHLKRWHGMVLAPKETELRRAQTTGDRASSVNAAGKKIAFVRGSAGWCLTTEQ